MNRPGRDNPLWFAFMVHRVSGLALVLFLPLHFWLLAKALNDGAALDHLLSWTDVGIVKFAEFGLVFLLAVHFFGGLRLLALELLPWRGSQKTLAAGALALGFLISVTFLLRAV